MRLHVLVEGPSERAFLEPWLARLLPTHRATIIPHRGKGRLSDDPAFVPSKGQEGLLDQLPAKLRAFGKSLDPKTDRVVVLVDADHQNCVLLKRRILNLIQKINPRPEVLVRIAVEETEAFYLGDENAIRQAFPRYDRALLRRYEPDSICGTWERFRQIIRSPVDEDKVRWAEAIAPHLTTEPSRTRSPSFRNLIVGLKRHVGDHA